MSAFKDLTGVRFGKLVAIKDAGSNKHKQHMWECMCDCGNKNIILGSSLTNGSTQSCGCISKELNTNVSGRRRENVPIVCGIYRITNPLGEVYIGSSTTIYRRWLRHREARKSIKIHISIKKYGWEEHTFEIIHQLPNDTTSEILLIYEQLYIDLHKQCGVIMLNVKDAGSCAKFSEDSKMKMSESQKKSYKVIFNGKLVEFTGLKKFCEDNGVSQKSLSSLLNSQGIYKNKSFLKNFKRAE